MAAASNYLASVTLELGGKSPTIVDETADLSTAAKNIVFSKFANAGQTCIAPDFVAVHATVKDKFLSLCAAEIKKAYGGEDCATQQASMHYARLVNSRHFERVKLLLDDAKAHGCSVLLGGGVSTDSSDSCFIQPTFLDLGALASAGTGAATGTGTGAKTDDNKMNSKLMTEEIFGPLLPIVTFSALDDVIAHVNAGPKPLALYMFSSSSRNIRSVLGRTVSGGAVVNGSLLQYMNSNLPFGGVNNSGVGNTHGFYGFKAFSHERAEVRVQISLVSRLLSAGRTPDWLRSAVQAAFKWV